MIRLVLTLAVGFCGVSIAAAESVFTLGPAARVAEGATIHYGFPRMVRAADGRLLLVYRVGVSHASDDSFIGLRHSTDDGRSWSVERRVWQAEKGTGAHNPVPLMTRSGRVVLWMSRYVFSQPGHERQPCVWCHSDDHGATWSEPTTFDAGTDRSCYYVHDAIQTRDGLLACDATFPPEGAGDCHVRVWRSTDDGRSWNVLSRLTQPGENMGDETALLETEPDTILCLLRHRVKAHPDIETTWRPWSRDGGPTWSERENVKESLDVLQRPLLTRLDERTILLTGRGRPRQTVSYLSRDNGRTFGDRFELEKYQAEGGCTAVVPLDSRRVVIAWHSDEGTTKGKPDIKVAELRIIDAK